VSRTFTWRNVRDFDELNRVMRLLVDVMIQKPHWVTSTADYTMRGEEDMVVMNAMASTLAVNMPPFDLNLTVVGVVKSDASTVNTVTILPFQDEHINGSTAGVILTEQWETAYFAPVSTQWFNI
jgi:hypothetical protein